MHRNRRPTLWATILLAALLATTAGCTEWLLAPFAGSFAAGYWAGYAEASGSATQTSICYRNGEPIDCSAVLTGTQP